MLLNILQWTGQPLSPGAVASEKPCNKHRLSWGFLKDRQDSSARSYLAGVPKEHRRGELK